MEVTHCHADFLKTEGSLVTNDIVELTNFVSTRNRCYTQLTPGEFEASYREVHLGGVQLIRESFNVGVRIEASPPASYAPFAAISTMDTEGSYFGDVDAGNTLIQACGGEWDFIAFNEMDYVCAVFNKDVLANGFYQLSGYDIPNQWLLSRAATINPKMLSQYRVALQRVMMLCAKYPQVRNSVYLQNYLTEYVLQHLAQSLSDSSKVPDRMTTGDKLQAGVRRVIDYLNSHSHELPTMQKLCEISKLSERSLQYGFRSCLNLTPVQYLRIIRLNSVRKELLVSDKHTTTVSDVAIRWGFFELGRFAGNYKQLFEESPSETLLRYQ